ncbi:MAG: DNA adenine methylase [Planctomycetes bacterium]|nr:DNA adenine methylase [Planctomycetota bacterium]
MTKGLKSPVCRIGGKGMLSGWLRQFIPEHVCYVEPFCGSAGLLFAKEPARVEILNDCDNHLISFFNVLKNPEKRERLINSLENLPFSRRLWQEIRQHWKHCMYPSDEVLRSAWWFFLNRSCFGGDQRYGGFACPSISGRNPAKTFRNIVDSLEHIAGRLQDVTIECLDYAECIRRYDSENTFFYIDAPYYGSEHYYGNSFTENDHYGLAELLHGIKGKVMVSHCQNSLYDSLYGGFNCYYRQSFKGSYKSNNGVEKPKIIECVWLNYQPESLFEGKKHEYKLY